MIINLRGSSGSGKTELVRRLMKEYGWKRLVEAKLGGKTEPIYLEGRTNPLGYRLPHPNGGAPLAVLGHYETTSGGADTIRMTDGGVTAIMRFAREHAAEGYDVLMEGLQLSSEHQLSTELARSHCLHVVRLTTPAADCVRNLIHRRRAGRGESGRIASNVASEQARIGVACRLLENVAHVEALNFESARARILTLLRIRNVSGA
jgi:hypothetical protein